VVVTQDRTKTAITGQSELSNKVITPRAAAQSAVSTKPSSSLVAKYGALAKSPAVAAAIKEVELIAGAKVSADRSEALSHGYWRPGASPTEAIMYGFVPPGMQPEQAAILSRALPKMPSAPRTGPINDEMADRLAGVPDPAGEMFRAQGLSQSAIAAVDQRFIDSSIRNRVGPAQYPLHRGHDRLAQPANSILAGTVRERANQTSSIQAQYSYDPYGQQTRVAGTGPDSDFGYAGAYVHQPSGLLLMGARFYSPTLGRFINRDPIGESGGVNLYAYVANNPINRTDPLGLQPITYGNFGGQGFVNGGPGSETTNFPHMIGQPGFTIPITPRDRCYYWHDVCLHNCARIGSSDPKTDKPECRQRCRKNCDSDLATCLGNVKRLYGNEGFPPTIDREIRGFSGVEPFPGQTNPGSPNDNPGAYVPGLQAYPPNYDPGYQGL
jgi:RHS repeat-associated protein